MRLIHRIEIIDLCSAITDQQSLSATYFNPVPAGIFDPFLSWQGVVAITGTQ
jgi:hypothetical protein